VKEMFTKKMENYLLYTIKKWRIFQMPIFIVPVFQNLGVTLDLVFLTVVIVMMF
jgi:hypothetical protein